MSGDVHVQFCERPGVRFPRATHLVILCEGRAAEALTVARRWMQALKLTLNETKTRTCDATQEPFGPMVHRPTGRVYVGAQPSRRAVARLRERVRGHTTFRQSGTVAGGGAAGQPRGWRLAALLLVRDREPRVLEP